MKVTFRVVQNSMRLNKKLAKVVLKEFGTKDQKLPRNSYTLLKTGATLYNYDYSGKPRTFVVIGSQKNGEDIRPIENLVVARA